MLNIPELIEKVKKEPRMCLRAHPRLYIDEAAVSRLRSVPETPMLRCAQKLLEEHAPAYAESTAFPFDETHHNALLIRARIMQGRIYTLLARWLQTGDESYRRGVLDSVSAMDAWPIWSWIDWFSSDVPDREAPFVTFDLSYGENCMTLAVAYDLLFPTLTAGEKQLFLDCIRGHKVFETFDKCVCCKDFHDRKGGGWFLQNEKCNWLAVLCGGMGMLSLAFYEEIPEAHETLLYCDEAMMTLLRFVDDCGGSWPEGLSYYSYTLRYAVAYLGSWENAAGKEHPAFRLPGVRSIITYFLDLQPGGIPCTFGDNNSPWTPMGFHYQLCRRLSQTDLCALIDAQYKEGTEATESWPVSVEWLLFAERTPPDAAIRPQESVLRFYPGSNVTVMADRLPAPHFTLVIRGGNTNGSHEHNDLSSFHCVLGRDMPVTSLSTDEYMDTTFSPRRQEIFEMTAAAKNVFLVNGVGMAMHSKVEQQEVVMGGCRGIRMDCTQAMGVSRSNAPAVRSYFRTFLMLADQAFLILDECLLAHSGRMETRLHTYAGVETADSGAVLHASGTAQNACLRLKGNGTPEPQTLYTAFAADKNCVLTTAVDAPTYPKTPSTMLRWVTKSFETGLTAAVLLSRIPVSGMEIAENPNEKLLRISLGQQRYTFYLSGMTR
ncbi:MAG: hypothetical protein SOW68_02540 [Eubacteriales bacterium]|nr:hypothetical protein [Eubacteriales bacterium]